MFRINLLLFLVFIAFLVAACAPTSAVPTATQAPIPTPTLPSGVIDAQAYASASSEQTLTLHLPKGRDLSAPVLYVPYGQYFPDLVSYFTERGYPVVTASVRNQTFQVETQDSFCGLAFIHAEAATYGLDPKRIVAVGGSMAGGTAAILAALEDPTEYLIGCENTLPETGRIAAVVSLAGVFDYSEEDDFFQGFYGNIRDFMGGTLEENPETWGLASAINHIDGTEPPFLLLHGTSDVNVNYHQSVIFAEVLDQAGVEVELVLLPDLDHGGIVGSDAAFAEIESFLKHLFP